MKSEAWIFGVTTAFLVIVAPAYWLVTDSDGNGNVGGGGGDWTGTSALVMTGLLTLMVTLYLGFHAKKMDPRPEDRNDGEIADGAGELGFFPPYSWWPLWCGLALAFMVYAVAAAAWWMFIVGATLGGVALAGLVFEYYRGEHAH